MIATFFREGTEFGLPVRSEIQLTQKSIMKKAALQDDRTNFTIGVASGFNAMKNGIGFAIFGLLIGSIVGFKWANYNFRQVENQAQNAKILEATNNLKSNPTASGQMPQQIVAAIKKARENPNDFDAQRQAAEFYMQVNKLDGALPFLQKSHELKPDDPGVMADLAAIYFEQKNMTEAVNWSRKAIGKEANHPLGKFYLMASLVESNQSLGEADKLLSELEKSAKAKGAPPEAQRALTQMRDRLQQARSNKGGGDAKTMLQHGPDTGVKK
jgi:tetratricopeptide (TPR) repeat protein